MNIFKYSILSIFAFIVCFGFVSCNHVEENTDSNNFIQAKSANISIYTSEDDEESITNYIGQNASKDKHLPVDDRYESSLNYLVSSPKTDEDINLNERILVFFNHQNTPNVCDQIPSKNKIAFENNFNGKLYDNVWGIGQKVLVIDIDQEIDEWLKTNFKSFELALIQINQNLGLSGIEGYFPKSNENQRKYSDSVEDLLMTNYGFAIDIPNNFRIVQSDSQFVWITNIEKESGFESIMINIFNGELDYSKISRLIENRNQFTHQYIHNDEGTQISVSESGAYNPILDLKTYTNTNKQSYHQFLGWYTELGTYRRGPFGRYLYQNRSSQTIAVDWFCGGKTSYNVSASKLTSIAKSFRLKP